MKNKKLKSITFISLLVVILVFTLTACNANTKTNTNSNININSKNLENFYNKIDKADNLTFIANFKAEEIVDGKIIVKFDNNKSHFKGLNQDCYFEIKDDKMYEYNFENKNWKVDENKNFDKDDNELTNQENNFKEVFKAKNYNFNSKTNKFEMKDDALLDIFGCPLTDLVIEIKNGNFILNGKTNYCGVPSDIEINIKDFDNTHVELPVIENDKEKL